LSHSKSEPVDIEGLKKARLIKEFDEAFTRWLLVVKLKTKNYFSVYIKYLCVHWISLFVSLPPGRRVLGFTSVEELYEWSGCSNLIGNIKDFPILILNAKDDPLIDSTLLDIPLSYSCELQYWK
jgi:predicted alpha/beta-fold hydrolase